MSFIVTCLADDGPGGEPGPRVRATQSGRVAILDGTMYLRPGPRLGQVLLAFAKALHPEAKW